MPSDERSEPELDVYVFADGAVAPVDAAAVLDAPAASPQLVDLALGLLAEGSPSLHLVWTADSDAPYRRVHLERVPLGRQTVVRLRARVVDDPGYGLTPRELDVLTLMVAGLTNVAIAAALVVSPRTVTTHVDHIMDKLGAPSRAAAATMALDRGILVVPLPGDPALFGTLRVGRVAAAAGTRRRQPAGVRAPRGDTNGPIVIGSLVPLEGRGSDDGVEMIRGASLAIDEINARGGVRGRPLQLLLQHVDVDSAGVADVVEGTRRLLGQGVHAITSGYLLHQARAVELAAAEGVPLLHASASSFIDDLVANDPDRFRGTFQVCPNDRNYAPNFVEFMTALRDTGRWVPQSRELVVARQSAWEIIDFGFSQARDLAEEYCWDLVEVAVSDTVGDDVAWAELPGRLGNPAGVMLGSFFADDHLRFLHFFLKRPLPCLLYSIYGPSVPDFRHRAGARADGLLWASTTGTYSDAIARRFVHAYRDRFATTPGRSMAGVAYDRIQILAQAWYQVDDHRDQDQVDSALSRTRYRGVNGAYLFEGDGHGTLPLDPRSGDPSITQAHTIFQIQNGHNVLLDPQLYATGKFRLPSWMTT